MTAEELKEKLRAIVMEVAELDEVPDGAAFKDLGIDSMMAIEIVADIERAFKIKIPEGELERVTDLLSVVGLVEGKIGG